MHETRNKRSTTIALDPRLRAGLDRLGVSLRAATEAALLTFLQIQPSRRAMWLRRATLFLGDQQKEIDYGCNHEGK